MKRSHRYSLFVFLVVAVLPTVRAAAQPASDVRYGELASLGEGTVRSFVELDPDGRPVSVGFQVDERALDGLPAEVPPYDVLEVMVPLPADAEVAPFDHLTIDWNPKGHVPEGIYTHPHFDFHFYTITEAERHRIDPGDPSFEARGLRVPEGAFTPAGYVSPPGNAAVPRMGLHLLDPATPELHGHAFTKTFIWGSFDGRIVFAEPMVSKAHLEGAKKAGGSMESAPIAQPAEVAESGYYPTRYRVGYDAEARAYVVALEGLRHRSAG